VDATSSPTSGSSDSRRAIGDFRHGTVDDRWRRRDVELNGDAPALSYGFVKTPQYAGDILLVMPENRREGEHNDRRAHPRGGRRDGDQGKPWYMRRRLWLAAASLLYVGWRRVRGIGHKLEQRRPKDGSNLAA